MAGAPLMPDYYNEKMNVAVLLAPPASLYNVASPLLQFASKKDVRELLVKALDLIHIYNFLPNTPLTTHTAVLLCDIFNHKLCDSFLKMVMNTDPSTDYPERFSVYASNEPSGGSVKDFIHYA